MKYLAFILGLTLIANFALAATNNAVSMFVKKAPIIAGVINDSEWRNAQEVSSFSQVWPTIDLSKDKASTVTFQHDEKYLYVAAKLKLNHPQVANTLQYNKSFEGDDEFILLLDTFASKQNAYWFSVNPNGVKSDGLIVNNTQQIVEWDGVWYAASKTDQDFWNLEMAIPLQILSFDPDSERWGLNLVRKVNAEQEEYRWQNPSQDLNYFEPRAFGDLSGISKVD